MLTNFSEVRQLGSDCLFQTSLALEPILTLVLYQLLLKNKKAFHVEVHIFNCG